MCMYMYLTHQGIVCYTTLAGKVCGNNILQKRQFVDLIFWLHNMIFIIMT